jgi:hypothetical protein
LALKQFDCQKAQAQVLVVVMVLQMLCLTQLYKVTDMFVILHKDGTFHGAMSILPKNYQDSQEFDIGKVKDAEPFDPSFNYFIIDGVAVRGEVKPVDTAEIQLIEAEIAANKYKRDRASAYPSIVDQLDMLYHGGYDAWRTAIQEIKTQFPKP